MSSHRFYIPPHAWKPERLALDPGEAHHALDVLRLEPAARVTVFNGEGAEATAEIVKVGRGSIELKKIASSKTPPLACAVTLAQAVPKGKNMELIIEKATELGAAAIAPLLSERTVVHCGKDEALKKKQKWQRVAVEACKQCGQNWLPRIETPQTPKDFFQAGQRFDLMLVASLQPDAKHLKAILSEHGAKRPQSVLILVGPEGDFTPAELSLVRSHGCFPITLGPIILRTETAAIYCLSILSHELLG
ncbi:MAG TPA: 16S rRNA (uracil(1498)-N(3))-methyltransferase [Chthoniobacteraceae bacterium]